MKFLKFTKDSKLNYGILEGDKVKKLSGSFFDPYEITEESFLLEDVKIEVPSEPSKIVCVGLNYKDHIEEFGKDEPDTPVIFLKPPTALIAAGESIILPKNVGRVDFEAELAIVIGKKCRNVSKENAKDVIFGYTCLNDVSARELQKKDGQWVRAKGYDTFAPVGPFIETEMDPDNVYIKSMLNDKTAQNSSTSKLIFNISYLINFISEIMTLLPGDIIATGTPMGVAEMKKGDNIKIEIENIGVLSNDIC